jgi:hypothetical protein
VPRTGRRRRPEPRSFPLSPNPRFLAVVECDVNHVGPATDGAVFAELLSRSLRDVNGDDNLFAAGVAEIGGLGAEVTAAFAFHEWLIQAGETYWARTRRFFSGFFDGAGTSSSHAKSTRPTFARLSPEHEAGTSFVVCQCS